MKTVDQPPRDKRYFSGAETAPIEVSAMLVGEVASDPVMTPAQVESIREIFMTPLTGSYNWDYESADGRIRRLYTLGKELNWNVDINLDWTKTISRDDYCTDQNFNIFRGWAPYDTLSESDKIRFDWAQLASNISQFLHGEQGALLVASQLISCAPTFDAKLYAASQTFDEARHVEVFSEFLKRQTGVMYPVNPRLKYLLDKILTDPRWDLKFVGMQIILEGLALAAFKSTRAATRIPVLSDLLYLVIRDESRHVTFGVNYLEEFCKQLSDQEREERALFAYEACVIMRDRLISEEVFAEFGWDVEVAKKRLLESTVLGDFRNLLFSRIMPNLKRIGLLTPTIRTRFDALGLLSYEHCQADAEIDWVRLSKPLFESGQAA